MRTLTKEQLHILQHALGLDGHGQGSWHRNHFVSGPECDNWGDLCKLVDMGHVVRHDPRELFGGSCCFVVTEGGKQCVRDLSQPPPKVGRSKARYRAWLRADTGASFGEWLRAQCGQP